MLDVQFSKVCRYSGASILSMEKMILNPDPADGSNPTDNELADIIDDVGTEYQNLDSTLDQLNAHMDVMEQQNDDLYAKFQDLLESSRQTRQELEAMRLAAGGVGEPVGGDADEAAPGEKEQDNLDSNSHGPS